MQIRTRPGKWGSRILTGSVILLLGAVVATLVLQGALGIDVVPALRDALAAMGLTGIDALLLGMGTVFALVGLSTTTGRGLPSLWRAGVLALKDPIPAGDLHLQSGSVEVEGVAESIDDVGTVNAPYSGTDCLGYRYRTEERRRDSDGDTDWRVVEEGERAVPFTVTDDSGTVVVDPEGAKLTFGRDIVSSTGGIKKKEWRLEPGESAYVSGQKCDGTTDSDAPGDASTYIGAGDDGSSFTVSDASETRTVLRFLVKGAIYTTGGLLFFGVGGGFLYFTLFG